MQVGVVFPVTGMGDDPGAIRAYAQAVEALGYRYILAYDSVISQGPVQEPLVLLGLLAGVTQRIHLVTGVLVLPSRPTLLVAKQAATIDALSGGRVRLGVGVGWNPVEYAAMGVPFDQRGQHVEEQIAILRQLWTEPAITFHGKWHTLEDVSIRPLPVQRPIPIWIGGESERAMERASRIADGWMADNADPFSDEVRARVERLRGYLGASGRPEGSFGIEAHAGIDFKSARTESQWRALAEAWRALGATHLSIKTTEAGLTQVDEHIEALRRVRTVLEF
jgi:probable F420-dependent oxidoreductase